MLCYVVQVTSLETVLADGPDNVYSCVLSEHLMCFCGILAAGTRSGHIYLIGTHPLINCIRVKTDSNPGASDQ